MSDFIKVNIPAVMSTYINEEYDQIEIEPKIEIVINKKNLLLCVYHNKERAHVVITKQLGRRDITREEYDRLCKELGVEDYEQWTKGAL